MKVPLAHWTTLPADGAALDRLDVDLCRVIEVLADIEHQHADRLATDDLVRLRAASHDLQHLYRQQTVLRAGRLAGAARHACRDRIA